MPPERVKHGIISEGVSSRFFKVQAAKPLHAQDPSLFPITQESEILPEKADNKDFCYPVTSQQRSMYRTPSGKQLTPHQWSVYDFVTTIPHGKVTTYKEISQAIGGSPRSVGSALRNNPFSPKVPCHRVIASNLFLGGFFGEWGKDHKTGKRYNDKIALLSQEGVHFDSKGHLLRPETTLWKIV
ncbi:DNA binding methylated-DNA--cysteine S-methyltransferase [Agrocybe pediades]|nr:DNA binding methylated-DNA--cysteine S-methyltransferase [Agrocybe pediades]